MASPHNPNRTNTIQRVPTSAHDPKHKADPNAEHWGALAEAIHRGEGPDQEINREPSNRHERRRAAAIARQRKVA